MFPLIIGFTLVCSIFAAPPQDGKEVAILKNEVEISPEGNYQYAYEAENGIHGEEQAQIKEISKEESAKAAQGAFGWVAPEGEKIEISYIADENGYQPQGDAIPTPPPIPPQIQKSLEYNAAHPEPEEKPQGRR